MNSITIYEFDVLVALSAVTPHQQVLKVIPQNVFDWLESKAIATADAGDAAWVRLTQRKGRRGLQVTNFVGVMRAPDGFQVEVLPKLGKVAGDDVYVRQTLIEMLRCLGGFRHIQTNRAKLVAARMPLLEVFIGEFLFSVEQIVKQGVRSDYNLQEGNVFALRGKLRIASHLRSNICRRDRFFTQFDEFTTNRPENRILRAALARVLAWTASQDHQQLARELSFAFVDVPVSRQPSLDFALVRLDRAMGHYSDALAWAKLILEDGSPLTGAGGYRAPSLLFPMEAVFEAFVAKHISKQLVACFNLTAQARSSTLVQHEGRGWFRLKPDLLVKEQAVNRLVLDSKWKLLDVARGGAGQKYQLAQSDFYQLHAYGQTYLNGEGDLVLIYPRSEAFSEPVPVFNFPKSRGLRLWVLPFCLESRALILPRCGGLDEYFKFS